MSAIVFYSQTGQTRKYVTKIKNCEKIEITPDSFKIEMTQPLLLVMPSYEENVHPIVIDTAEDFLETAQNAHYCKGIFGGGNRNFAQLFCITAKTLSEKYDLPLLHEFEFQGSRLDVEKIQEELDKIGYIR